MKGEWGPSERVVVGLDKFKLMMALFTRQPVALTLERTGQIAVTINEVQAEDGSAESWNVLGFVNGQAGREFKAYLRTDRQNGVAHVETRVRVTA